MLQLLKLYSGILAIIVPTVFDIVPFIVLRKKNKRLHLFSDLSKARKTKWLFKITMFFTAIFQVLFALLLIEYSNIHLGSIIYLIACFGTFGIAIFNLRKYKKFHDVSSYFFFIGVLISYLLNGIYYFEINRLMAFISIFVFLLELIVVIKAILIKKYTNVEFVHSFVGSIWIIAAYLLLILR